MTLHILDDRDPQACGTTLALLAQTLRDSEVPSRVLLMGGSALEAQARSLGVEPLQRVGVPLGRPLLAPTAVHHAMYHGNTPHAGQDTDHEVEAWTLQALSAAAAFRPSTARTLHITQRPDPATARRLHKLMYRAGFNVRTLTQGLREDLLRAGLPSGRVYVEPADIGEVLDRSADAAPGFDVDPRTRTVVLLSEPAAAASVDGPAFALALTREVTGQNLRLIVHPRQAGRAEQQPVAAGTGHADLFVQTAALDTPWRVLPHADAVLLSNHAGPLSIDLAARTGRPIIAPDQPWFRELLNDRPNVFWSVDARPRNLAHALTTWATGQPGSAPASQPVHAV